MVTIRLPENLTIKYLSPPAGKDTPWFTCLNRYSFSQGIIFFEESLVHKRVLVTPEDYQEYKRSSEGLARQTDKQAVLERVSQTE